MPITAHLVHELPAARYDAGGRSMMSMTRPPPSAVPRGCKVRMIGAWPEESTGRGVRSSSVPPIRLDVTAVEAGIDTAAPDPTRFEFVLEDTGPGTQPDPGDAGAGVAGAVGVVGTVGLMPGGAEGLFVPVDGGRTVDGDVVPGPVENGRGPKPELGAVVPVGGATVLGGATLVGLPGRYVAGGWQLVGGGVVAAGGDR